MGRGMVYVTFKVNDEVLPLIGNFKDQVGKVIEVEDRINGSITVQFSNEKRGLYFKNELKMVIR